MRYLVVGGGGMLGHDVVTALAGREITALGRDDLDVRDAIAVRETVAGYDAVVNATAYSEVDGAETDEAAAFAVNADGAVHLARACAETGAAFVHVSTDYVFAGDAEAPYAEDAPRNPINAYGRSKAAGEVGVLEATDGAAYVLRTAWLYGEHGRSFPATMLKLAADRATVDVVNDQLGQPTWTRDLADRIVDVLDRRPAGGVYHATNTGQCSWFEFARAVFEIAGLDPERVHPTNSALFARPAARPSYSVLGQDRWAEVGMAPLRRWRDALDAAFAAGALKAR